MDNKALHDKFRQQLTNVHALTVLTVSLIEIIGYIVLVCSGRESLALHNAYLWYGVVLPIAVNAVTHVTARRIANDPAVSRRKRNGSIVIAALITSFVVAVIHREYIVTGCAFIFPIMLSAMFNDRKLLNTSIFVSVFILFSMGVAFWLDRAITLHIALSLIILCGFVWVAYLCGAISINFSKQNYTTIESQAEENDRLMEDVRKDQMTGLYNHSAFIERLDEMLDKRAPGAPLCLAMVDVDDFKAINDTFGHDCGDAVLIRLAKILQKHCGEEDTAFRYGGEEFAVIFGGKDETAACAAMREMLAEFRGSGFAFTDAPITFSSGVAAHAQDMSRDQLFEIADQTLYLAKREGKNRVLGAFEKSAE